MMEHFTLISVCITSIVALVLVISFTKYLVERNDPVYTFVDLLLSEESFYISGTEKCYKRLYKRTWSNGNVEYYDTTN